MNFDADPALAHHRRDVRRAIIIHALLITLLILLWFVNSRAGVLGKVEEALLGSLFRGS